MGQHRRRQPLRGASNGSTLGGQPRFRGRGRARLPLWRAGSPSGIIVANGRLKPSCDSKSWRVNPLNSRSLARAAVPLPRRVPPAFSYKTIWHKTTIARTRSAAARSSMVTFAMGTLQSPCMTRRAPPTFAKGSIANVCTIFPRRTRDFAKSQNMQYLFCFCSSDTKYCRQATLKPATAAPSDCGSNHFHQVLSWQPSPSPPNPHPKGTKACPRLSSAHSRRFCRGETKLFPRAAIIIVRQTFLSDGNAAEAETRE